MNFLRAIANLLRFDRTNWKALTLCLFAAGVFWIFNALNKTHDTNLRFPLQFEFDNTKFIPTEPLPSTLTINVRGNGWDLLRESVGLKIPNIFLPLERPTETRKIVASSLSPLVASQIGTLQVNYIVTDTLRLKIEPKMIRKMKLKADLDDVTYKKGSGRISPIVILPDSVTLEGPKSLIEKLDNTIALKVNASRLSNNFRENAEVAVSNNELISRNPPVAEVIFEVGAVEESVQYVPLKTSKIPWATDVDRDSVRCIFSVPQKEHDLFQADLSKISASISLGEIPKGQTRSFLPLLKGMPAYAEVLHIDSVKVKKY